MTIEHIEEGMQWSRVFSILNSLIDAVNSIDGSLGEVLVNGHLDYTALVNKPSINGVELSGNKTQDNLQINISSAVQLLLSQFGTRLTSQENAATSLDSRATVLESFKSTYQPKVDNLETGRTADQARITSCENNRVTDAAAITALQSRANGVDTSIAALNTQQDANNALVDQRAGSVPDIVTKLNEVIVRLNDQGADACLHMSGAVCRQAVQQLVID